MSYRHRRKKAKGPQASAKEEDQRHNVCRGASQQLCRDTWVKRTLRAQETTSVPIKEENHIEGRYFGGALSVCPFGYSLSGTPVLA